MLQGRDNAMIPTLLWDYWSGGETNKAAAAGVWLVIGLLAVVTAWQLVARLATRGSKVAPLQAG